MTSIGDLPTQVVHYHIMPFLSKTERFFLLTATKGASPTRGTGLDFKKLARQHGGDSDWRWENYLGPVPGSLKEQTQLLAKAPLGFFLFLPSPFKGPPYNPGESRSPYRPEEINRLYHSMQRNPDGTLDTIQGYNAQTAKEVLTLHNLLAQTTPSSILQFTGLQKALWLLHLRLKDEETLEDYNKQQEEISRAQMQPKWKRVIQKIIRAVVEFFLRLFGRNSPLTPEPLTPEMGDKERISQIASLEIEDRKKLLEKLFNMHLKIGECQVDETTYSIVITPHKWGINSAPHRSYYPVKHFREREFPYRKLEIHVISDWDGKTHPSECESAYAITYFPEENAPLFDSPFHAALAQPTRFQNPTGGFSKSDIILAKALIELGAKNNKEVDFFMLGADCVLALKEGATQVQLKECVLFPEAGKVPRTFLPIFS